jgi:ligand-binding sensor domain-containing protein
MSYTVYDRNTVFENSDLQVLLVHRGVIFAGGFHGLFRLNNRTDYWYHYREADGLISDQVRSLAPDGGYIWIGTAEGVTRFLWDNRTRSDWRR